MAGMDLTLILFLWLWHMKVFVPAPLFLPFAATVATWQAFKPRRPSTRPRWSSLH